MHSGEDGFGIWWQGLEVGHILAEALLSWHVECKGWMPGFVSPGWYFWAGLELTGESQFG